jgi:hypothetical protein
MIRVTREETRITLMAPPHPDLPGLARSLDGWAERGVWCFGLPAEPAVRALARRLFGTDGDDRVPLVTLRCRLGPTDEREGEVWRFGRLLVARRGRDQAVRLGRGVTLVEGDFPSRAGRLRAPRVFGADGVGVVLEVQGVPVTLAKGQGVWVVSE